MLALLRLIPLLAATPVLAQQTASQWIWYPEVPAVDCVNQSRWLRRVFDLPAGVKSAALWLGVDDGARLWVNGKGPLSPVEGRGVAQRWDLAAILHPGRNVLACEVSNGPGAAGLIVKLTVALADGGEVILNSDASWKASKTLQPGWTEAGFDDSGWVAALSEGDAYKGPWNAIPVFHTEVFITAAEAGQHRAWMESVLRAPAGLASEPPTRAELRQTDAGPVLFLNGEPQPAVMYRGTVDPFDDTGRRLLGSFRDAGVHVFCAYTLLERTWVGPGKYDFDGLDTYLRAFLSVDPQARLILHVRLIPPDWWMEAHPTEWVRYGTSDSLDASDESWRVKRASPASEAWRRDAGAAWGALIAHLEGRPWGKRVIGYHAGYGIYTEWHYFGSWSNQYPDTGEAMTRTFRAWLRAKYGDVARLRQAWGDPQASFDTAAVPGVEPRERASLIAFRDPAREQRVIDYYRCHQGVIADDIAYFGRIAKQETGRRALFGIYYGYFFGVAPQTQGGHLELERLLRSPDIDYFVAPYDYGNRLMGQDGRLRALATAIARAGKVHIIEADTRTHLHPVDEYGRARNLAESLACVRREFSTALTERAAFWYVDFGPDSGRGWFDDPQIMSLIADLQKLRAREITLPRFRTSQIALVYDLGSGYYLGDGEGMAITNRMVTEVATEMFHLGTPFDGLLLSQLETADLSQYKMLVFLNTFAMTDRQAAAVERIRQAGRQAMVFLWAPGLDGPDGLSARRASQVTGFDLSLLAEHLPGRITVPASDDPLVRDLPTKTELGIAPTEAVPVADFGDVHKWLNPRDAATMKQEYKRFEVAPAQDGVRWTFDTKSSWTDVHFDAPIGSPAAPGGAAGIGLRMRVVGPWQRLTVQCVIKDADWAEFATPEAAIPSGGWEELQYPLAAFTNAPWARVRPAAPALPLKGMKFVLRGTDGAGPCEVDFAGLRWLRGQLTRREVRSFGDAADGSSAVFGPGLIPSGAGCTVLGRIGDTARPGLVRSGQGAGLTVFCAVPFVPRQVLAAVAREAGVHQYDDHLEDVVRADSRLLAIHTREGGPRTIHLLHRGTVTDALSGQVVGRAPGLVLTLPPTSTTLLEVKPPL